ncbi:hypothetical protein ES708_10253 [subsurface metagenome]
MRHARRQSIIEKKPIPTDVKSLAQLSWRHMYQKAVVLWHALSGAEQQEWESSARRKHMTGFAWFMSQALKPNPGLYLPLQGGVMAGNIDMAKNRLLNLPDPTDDQEAARKKYVDDKPGMIVHGVDWHTDVTRTLFIPSVFKTTGTLDAGGYFFQDGSVKDGYYHFRVPCDGVVFQKIEALWWSGAVSGNMRWVLRADHAAAGEHKDTHTDAPLVGTTATAGANILNLQEPANPLTLPGLALDDYLKVKITRYGDHVDDTLDAYVLIIGLLFTYTADQ